MALVLFRKILFHHPLPEQGLKALSTVNLSDLTFVVNPIMHDGSKRSYILNPAAFSFICLSMYDLLLPPGIKELQFNFCQP